MFSIEFLVIEEGKWWSLKFSDLAVTVVSGAPFAALFFNCDGPASPAEKIELEKTGRA